MISQRKSSLLILAIYFPFLKWSRSISSVGDNET